VHSPIGEGEKEGALFGLSAPDQPLLKEDERGKEGEKERRRGRASSV
jgi:hypothetical protein